MSTPQRRESLTAGRSRALIALLVAVMAVTVFAGPSLGILSRFIIDELDITRTQLGILVTGAGLSGAVLGPSAGRLADRIGARSTLLLVFGTAAVGLTALALAPNYALLVAAVGLAGVAQSGSNPSTNKLIGLHFPPGKRGLVTGIKQSGVQLGIFLGGLTLPAAAVAFNWRIALAAWAMVSFLAFVAASLITPRDPEGEATRDSVVTKDPLPVGIRWLALDGILNGAVVGSVLTYLPLYAEEEIGLSVGTAGVVASVFALSGLAARLAWPHFAEASAHYSKPLTIVAFSSTVGIVLLWSGPVAGPWALWAGAAIVGTAQAWNAIANLAVIGGIEQRDAGRASGSVARGFGLGLAFGPPGFGFVVDSLGGYEMGYGLLTLVGMAAGAIMILWGRRRTV